MSFATGLLCRECGTAYHGEARYSCEYCFGPLEVAYDLEAARSQVTRSSIMDGPGSIWRYAALLPDPGTQAVDLGAGWTPLRRASRLGEILGLKELWLKDDTRNPTGSFKDRVVSVALSSARRLGLAPPLVLRRATSPRRSPPTPPSLAGRVSRSSPRI